MNNRYAYFEDHFNNQYRWSTVRQADGKFHVEFMKHKIVQGWETFEKTKSRSFKLRKKAKEYCVIACRKAKAKQKPILEKRNKKWYEQAKAKAKRQAEVLERRKEAKAKRDSLKPKGREKAKIEAKKKRDDLIKLIKKADTKIKSLTTRKKRYLKKLKYYDKRLAGMKDVYISKNRNIPKYSEIED